MKRARIRIIGIMVVALLLWIAEAVLIRWAASENVWAMLLAPQGPGEMTSKIAGALLASVRFTFYALLPGFAVMQLLFAILDARLARLKRAAAQAATEE